MSKANSFYMADVIYDGSDGNMHGINVFADNFTELIDNIELKSKHVGKIQVWSALYVYGGGTSQETSQVKIKVIETLKARKVCKI
tara:strand:+ start:360 stop:614 length:255 start_codon:yes stop_codon:yes gene_type:complete